MGKKIVLIGLLLSGQTYNMEQLSKLSDQQLADAHAYILSHKKKANTIPIVLSGLAATGVLYSCSLLKDGKPKKAIALAGISAVTALITKNCLNKCLAEKELWDELERRIELERANRQRARL